MGLFFAYIIKSTFCLTLFYLFYRLLLSRETFHRFNRIALFSLILLSVAIPFIKLSTKEVTAIQSPMLNFEQYLQLMQPSPLESTQSLVLQIFLLIYLTGIFLFICQYLHSAWRIVRIIRSGEKARLQKDITVVIAEKDIIPFSWMKYIVISRRDWEDSKDEILTHEMAHIRYRHSWDILLSGVCVVFHWFNPAAWLLKQELQNIHEYEADECVINQGIDAKRYQLLLIKKAVGTQRFTSMANSFNHSKLKKRITMMLKSKSNKWARLKYLYVLPLAAIAITAFARPEISLELEKISSTKISELPLIKEVIPPKNEPLIRLDEPVYPEDNPQQKVAAAQKTEKVDIQKYIDEGLANIHADVAVEKANLDKFVEKMLAEVTAMNGKITPLQEKEINEKIEQAIKQTHEKMEKIAAKHEKDMTIRISYAITDDENIAIFIDGVRVSQKEFSLDPDNIDNVKVQRDEEFIKSYGENLDGVIFIQTKKEK